jgi:steroid 5-alpha reductase family enzyme
MLVVIGLIIAFLLVVLFSNRATRACRWREYPQGETSRWVCVNCGAQTVGAAGKAPRVCLRDEPPEKM